MVEIKFATLAYCKMFLHLAKYPYSSCNGVLLSRKKGNTIEYVDCIPLFHSSLSLAPAVEVAFTQIDAFCEQNGLEIGGYYHANENANDNQPNLIAHKLAEKLKENCSYSLMFMINNQKINPSNKVPFFQVYTFSDQRLKEYQCDVVVGEDLHEKCLELLSKKHQNTINDFDNHLDDIKHDWRNSSLNKQIDPNARVQSLSKLSN